MDLKTVLFFIFLNAVSPKISIDIKTESSMKNVSITYSGADIQVINAQEIGRFQLNSQAFKQALKTHFGKKPRNYYFKSPTPWGDLYKEYNWEQVTRILTVKSAKVHNIVSKPVVVLAHDFENPSNKTIKVTTGISQTVENTVTTSWTRSQDVSISQDIEYDLNILVAKLSGTTGLTYTSSFGKSEEKSESVTIGTTSGVETELKPGQSVTAVLSANRGYFEIEVVYAAKLKGNVAVNFKRSLNGHHFWGPPIENIFPSGGLQNEVTEVEHIKVGFYAEASLKVYDKDTGLPL